MPRPKLTYFDFSGRRGEECRGAHLGLRLRRHGARAAQAENADHLPARGQGHQEGAVGRLVIERRELGRRPHGRLRRVALDRTYPGAVRARDALDVSGRPGEGAQPRFEMETAVTRRAVPAALAAAAAVARTEQVDPGATAGDELQQMLCKGLGRCRGIGRVGEACGEGPQIHHGRMVIDGA